MVARQLLGKATDFQLMITIERSMWFAFAGSPSIKKALGPCPDGQGRALEGRRKREVENCTWRRASAALCSQRSLDKEPGAPGLEYRPHFLQVESVIERLRSDSPEGRVLS